jgi:hypothetical protein
MIISFKQYFIRESFIDKLKSIFSKKITHDIKIDIDSYLDEIYVYLIDDRIKIGTFTFKHDNKNLKAIDIWVSKEHRGKGLAKMVYDILSERGYKIYRSSDQTAAGKHFWDKNRPNSKPGSIW